MRIFKSILDAIFPENYTCELCGRDVFDNGRLCPSCKKRVIFNDGVTCPVCGRKTKVAELCIECKALAPEFKMAVSAIVYEDGAKNLIHAFKNDKPYLKEYFADLISEKCQVFEDAEAITYVPMTDGAKRKRGYNQAFLLAKALSKRLNLPLLKKAIIKTKKTPPQKTLTKAERLENLRTCFKAEKSLVDGKKIIVVDDVMTTGATADAISIALKKKGAKAVYFATVASVEYKGEL